MKFRQIGSTDIEVSVIALGTSVMGGSMWGGCDDEMSFNTVRTAIDSGITTIDTAPIYGFGRSEEIVGKAISSLRRDSIVLCSKCGLYWSEHPLPSSLGKWHCFADYNGYTESFQKFGVYRWLRSDVIRKSIEDSLRRLRTDYIDLIQIHYPSDGTTPFSEVMGTLEKMRSEGKIRAIGIANVSRAQLDDYLQLGSVDTVQGHYSILDRSVEKNGILDVCRKKEMTFFACTPLERGLLTGSLDPTRVYKYGDQRINDPLFKKENVKNVNNALREINSVAKRYNLSTAQFATAWVANCYGKCVVLCGARTPEQALENAESGYAQLSEDDMEEVDAILRDFELLPD